MTAIGNRRSIVIYSDPSCIHSHRVRVVLAEKGIATERISIDPDDVDAELQNELLEVNPGGALPVLLDRDLALYDARVIIDYLDERYPHPPLMPDDPVSRARTRLAQYRIEADWYTLRPDTQTQEMTAGQAAAALGESLTAASEVFAAMPFFFGQEYSILDATLAPLLWRLPAYGIVLPEEAAPVLQYARRIFARPGFQASLSDTEREMEYQ